MFDFTFDASTKKTAGQIDLRSKAAPEAGAAVAAERVAYIQKLDKAIAELKARQ